MLLAVVSVAIMLSAITIITANPYMPNTPLYTLRMEQASSKMNFLPTEGNDFTYTTERGYNLDYGAVGSSSEIQSDVSVWTCPTRCQNTCRNTCPDTCPYTCKFTCQPSIMFRC